MHTILHIGTEKTGTTALQASFVSSRPRLAEAKILYPRTLWARNQFCMALYGMDKARTTHLGERNALFTSNRNAYRHEVERRLANEISSSSPNTLILSSEIMAAQLITEAEVQRLRDLLDTWSTSYTIIVYLRRQDRVSTSLHSTDLRAGSSSSDALGSHPFTPAGFDYHRLLSTWSAVFGKSSISPVVYEEAKKDPRGLMGSFSDSSGIELSTFDSAPPSANSSLSAKAQELLLEYNRIHGGTPAISPRDLTARNIFIQALSHQFPGPPPRPSRAAAERYLHTYRDSNRAVALEWFNRSELFDNDFSHYPEEAESSPHISRQEIIETMNRLALRASAESQRSKS